MIIHRFYIIPDYTQGYKLLYIISIQVIDIGNWNI